MTMHCLRIGFVRYTMDAYPRVGEMGYTLIDPCILHATCYLEQYNRGVNNRDRVSQY